jgi:CheY-like chemotaxis protein
MPMMDGFEAARRVRSLWSDRESIRPRMIAMTSSASQVDRDLSLEAGMDDYISKPFTVDTLREALERWGPR